MMLVIWRCDNRLDAAQVWAVENRDRMRRGENVQLAS